VAAPTTIIAIGKLRPSVRACCDEYLKRVGRFGEIRERQLREAPGTEAPAVQRRTEGRRLLEAIPDHSIVIALDRSGTAWTSEALATALRRWLDTSRPISLMLGGSTGLDDAVLARADYRWSLGPLTLPHELARLVVIEQWYRAWTILRREPYHK
jgi:23S rRNA (pseudouridine1915-N3)-methyltransferase